jgi:hypothetical protein
MDDIQDEGTGGIKELRDAAERGKKASQELDSMKREMAFLKAGVDTDSKAGQLLYKAYDGELETDLLRAEAEELGILRDTQAAPTPTTDNNDVDRQGMEERRALAGDNVPPESQTESPYDAGHREFKAMMDAGRPKDDSAAKFVHKVLEAAGGDKPDPRVLSER